MAAFMPGTGSLTKNLTGLSHAKNTQSIEVLTSGESPSVLPLAMTR